MSCVAIAGQRRRHEKFPFYSTSPRKSPASCCSNERWWYSNICYSNTASNATYSQCIKITHWLAGLSPYMYEETYPRSLVDAIVLIFPVIQKCSVLNLYWCHLSSMRWRAKHLWQIITFWSKSTGGTKHWLHRDTEQRLGAEEDVLLINCRKRTKKIFS